MNDDQNLDGAEVEEEGEEDLEDDEEEVDETL